MRNPGCLRDRRRRAGLDIHRYPRHRPPAPAHTLIQPSTAAIVPHHNPPPPRRDLFVSGPAGIIKTLNWKRPIYQPTAAYGHFGRTPHDGLFPWERVDMAETLDRKSTRL